MSEWIKWNGGECPVDYRKRVQVKFIKSPHEKENMVSRTVKAKNIIWEHITLEDGSPSWGNVIAYKEVDAK